MKKNESAENYLETIYVLSKKLPSDISYNDGVYTYSFNFYGNPSINQIQILSYDKETIYCTYDVSTQSGKTYTYTQEVTIE